MTRVEDVNVQFVMEKRRLNASWGAIARMTGCSETALRDRFGGQVPALLRPTGGVVNSPRRQVELYLASRGLSADHARIVARLWHANGAVLTGMEAAQGVAGGGAAQDECKAARQAARDRIGLTFGPKGFALTHDDVVALGRAAGVSPEGKSSAGARTT